MVKATRSLARHDTEKAADGLTEASKAVQKMGDGIIRRIPTSAIKPSGTMLKKKSLPKRSAR